MITAYGGERTVEMWVVENHDHGMNSELGGRPVNPGGCHKSTLNIRSWMPGLTETDMPKGKGDRPS